jgi:hypothetical protein
MKDLDRHSTEFDMEEREVVTAILESRSLEDSSLFASECMKSLLHDELRGYYTTLPELHRSQTIREQLTRLLHPAKSRKHFVQVCGIFRELHLNFTKLVLCHNTPYLRKICLVPTSTESYFRSQTFRTFQKGDHQG